MRIKILQTLPLLVKPASYLATPMFLSQMFEVCFRMLHDKSPIIQHTAEATVRQVPCCVLLIHPRWCCMRVGSPCSWLPCYLNDWKMILLRRRSAQSRLESKMARRCCLKYAVADALGLATAQW